MADGIAEIMNTGVRTVTPDTTLRETAEIMRDEDVGDLVVTSSGHLHGMLTDRDIVVRCVAEVDAPAMVRVGEVCSTEVVTVPRQSSVKDAVHTMRTATVRRPPVVDDDEVIGVVTMGDLAQVVDERSAQADVSAAAPNR